LAAFEEKVISRRSEALLPELNGILGNKTIANTWQASGAGLYRNWLGHISAQKETVLVSQPLKAMAGCQEILGAPHQPTFLWGDVA
jgi:hypothetical protein